jgi:hypothetical protein
LPFKRNLQRYSTALGWDSYAHFEEEVMSALESDQPVRVVRLCTLNQVDP